MDYEQDYTNLDIADNRWYDTDSRENSGRMTEGQPIPRQAAPREPVTARMLDNEDFD
ncbi:MAG: hypothetical protein K2L39_00110 [Muribaculaceae bacterium]|nr:hypothetical protein [Muribaculaceae bacterium]MDE6359618.1 hypothetical protein [Muribaculaceae bacterium]